MVPKSLPLQLLSLSLYASLDSALDASVRCGAVDRGDMLLSLSGSHSHRLNKKCCKEGVYPRCASNEMFARIVIIDSDEDNDNGLD